MGTPTATAAMVTTTMSAGLWMKEGLVKGSLDLLGREQWRMTLGSPISTHRTLTSRSHHTFKPDSRIRNTPSSKGLPCSYTRMNLCRSAWASSHYPTIKCRYQDNKRTGTSFRNETRSGSSIKLLEVLLHWLQRLLIILGGQQPARRTAFHHPKTITCQW